VSNPFLPVSRRTVLRGGAVIAGGALAVPLLGSRAVATPAQVRAGRPVLTHGIQSGDVGQSSATVWTRADRPSRMVVEVSTRPDFKHSWRVPGALLTPRSDFTGKTVVSGLPDGADVYYRVTAVDLADPRRAAEPLTGHFRTVPCRAPDVSFLWSGDLGGQGYGIDPALVATAYSGRWPHWTRTSSSATATTCTPTTRSKRRSPIRAAWCSTTW